MNKVAVITSIFGQIDSLSFPVPQSFSGFDFLYIDERFTHPVLPENFSLQSDRYKAKYFKVLTHKIFPDYDIYIWLDGRLQIAHCDVVSYLIQELDGFDLLLRNNPNTNCMFKDEKYILNCLDGLLGKDLKEYFSVRFAKEEIKTQVDAYRLEIPVEAGYWLGGIFARRNNDITNKFFEDWWDKIIQHGLRDQFSLAYLVIKSKKQLDSSLRIKEMDIASGWIKSNEHYFLK